MTKSKYGTVIVLSGPSGVGKSTLVKNVRELMPKLEFSISCTTRPPRPGEKHGVNYYFLTHEEFDRRIGNDEFIEYAQVFDNKYGTLKSEVLDRISRGKSVLLDIDVQGAMKIRKAAQRDSNLAKHTVWVFIAPPSLEILEKRLRGRATDSEEQIALRLGTARRELSFWKSYDYLVVNDDLAVSTAEMTGLFRSFDLRTANQSEELFL